MLHQIDLSRVDLNLLVLFEAVMDTRHVGRAAARLNLSPSAASHGLGRLRTLIGDPVFLRTPKGVTPTERGAALAPLVADVLARVRQALAVAEPFDPKHATRRFTIGVPDGVAATLLPNLLRDCAGDAPGIGFSVRQLLPVRGAADLASAWAGALAELDERRLDLAILPTSDVPKRFARHVLFEESFILAVRAGHRCTDGLDLPSYCTLDHVVVSESGEPVGNIDLALAERGLSRRVALTTPNTMLALALLPATDLVCAVSQSLVAHYGAMFGVVAVTPPLPLPRYAITAIAPSVALQDHGLAWLLDKVRIAGG